jgi:hypothetical protein
VTLISVSRAPFERLLDYRGWMGWSLNWASSYESDFNLEFAVSAGQGSTHGAAMPPLAGNEVTGQLLAGGPLSVRTHMCNLSLHI